MFISQRVTIEPKIIYGTFIKSNSPNRSIGIVEIIEFLEGVIRALNSLNLQQGQSLL